MRRPSRPLFWLALLAAAPAGAACTSTDTCLAAVARAQAGSRTISARFTQTKHLALLDEPLVSTGRFFYQHPDRIRLDIETPHPATVIVNGRDISIPGITGRDAQQLSMTPIASMFRELGGMFAGSTEQLRRNFAVEAAPGTEAVELTLIPTVPEWQGVYRTIRLRFAEPDMILAQMRLDDALGDRVEIDMRDVQRNVELPADLFAIAPTPPR